MKRVLQAAAVEEEVAFKGLPSEFRVPDDCEVQWVAESKVQKGRYAAEKGAFAPSIDKALRFGSKSMCQGFCTDVTDNEFRPVAHVFKKS